MKHLRNVLTLVLAAFVALVVATPAFAAELTTGTKGAVKTITIKTPDTAQDTDEFKYEIFKVFDATSDGESTGISYKLMESAGGVAPTGFTVDDSGNVYLGTVSNTATGATGEIVIKVDGATKYLTPQTTALTADQIKNIQDYAKKVSVGTTTITGKSTEKTVVLPDYGYYFITTTSGTVVTIDSTNPSAAVDDKNTLPTMDKDIASVTSANGGNHAAGADNESTTASEQSATANVGDTVNYTVTINAKKGADSYVYHDVLSAGLTLVTTAEPVVKAGTTTLTKGTDYTLTKFANNTPNGSADNITITFAKTYLDSITADTTITITYSAIVNENAVIAGTGNPNKGTLDYGHNGEGQPNTTPPDEPKVYVYQFQLVKDNGSKKVLTGAEFKFYQEQACTNEIALVKVVDGKYRVATPEEKTATGFKAAVIEAGTPEIIGLGNGTYYLKETKAPEGYNLLNDPVAVTIADANNNATFTTTTTENDTYASGGVEVINQQGTELPSTGGMGTTILYTIGGIMLVGGAIALVSKKRVANMEK